MPILDEQQQRELFWKRYRFKYRKMLQFSSVYFAGLLVGLALIAPDLILAALMLSALALVGMTLLCALDARQLAMNPHEAECLVEREVSGDPSRCHCGPITIDELATGQSSRKAG